jgi:hypothetical protein
MATQQVGWIDFSAVSREERSLLGSLEIAADMIQDRHNGKKIASEVCSTQNWQGQLGAVIHVERERVGNAFVFFGPADFFDIDVTDGPPFVICTKIQSRRGEEDQTIDGVWNIFISTKESFVGSKGQIDRLKLGQFVGVFESVQVSEVSVASPFERDAAAEFFLSVDCGPSHHPVDMD